MKTSLTDCREIGAAKKLQPFFVTGLPRSRTAWLANLLTTDTTICYHDQPVDFNKTDSGKVVGFAGPQVCKQFIEVSRMFPTAPWLIVLREQSEALAALNRVAPAVEVPTDYWDMRRHLISSLCSKWQAMTVNFDDLDDESTVRLVWAHLLPGLPFDVERFELLRGFNVQQQVPA